MTDHHAAADAFTKHLLVVMLFGAARQDATTEQLGRMRDECIPLMKDPAVPLTEVIDRLHKIMGRRWEPKGEFGDYIDGMIADWKRRHP